MLWFSQAFVPKVEAPKPRSLGQNTKPQVKLKPERKERKGPEKRRLGRSDWSERSELLSIYRVFMKEEDGLGSCPHEASYSNK